MQITLSIDNLNVKNALSCKQFEIRRAYVIFSRDGIVTAQKLSENENEVLKQALEYYEVQTDIDCLELRNLLHDADVLKMFSDLYKGRIEDEKYDEEFKRQEAIGFEKNFHARCPEPDDAYEADQTLPILFQRLCEPKETEYQPPVDPKEFDDIPL